MIRCVYVSSARVLSKHSVAGGVVRWLLWLMARQKLGNSPAEL